MNAINGALTAFFDLVLRPLEAVGPEFSLTIVSGIFGILALIAFKHISWQKGIKATKDKIKGHMIEIRLYQDDLVLVSKAICKVLLRNFQYLLLNFGPFIPLAVPFVFVVAQMVVRYAFDPVELRDPQAVLAGGGTTIKVELDAAHRGEADQIEVVLPEGVVATSKLVPARDFTAQEVVAVTAGEHDIVIRFQGQEHVKKLYAWDAGPDEDHPRRMQPERVASFWLSFLWPSEDTFSAESGIARVSFVYPESDLGWIPLSGPLGVIVWVVVASMAFGFAMLKPLGVQI